MKRTVAYLPLTLSAMFGFATLAHADVCVQLDTSKDTLAENDRRGAVLMFEQALRNLGAPLGPNCTETFSLSHVALGQSINVFVNAPQGFRQGQAARLEELPNLYDQLLRSLFSGVPVSATSSTTTRQNVTTTQMAPRRVQADSLWYIRLGYGTSFGPEVTGGPAFGFGYRYELDDIGLDVSFLNFHVDSDGDAGGINGSWVKLMGLYFLNPIANASSYLGGGISWGGTAVGNNDQVYSGSGIQAELTAGYEFLRASSIRLFAQLDATLPLYRVHSSYNGGDASWAPTLVASLGIGWGRGITRVHVIQ